MKKILLFLLMIPVWGYAQTASKYLVGAVPVVDGKVTFTQTINVPGSSKESIYNMVNNWAEEQFKTDEQFPNNKLITQNAEAGEIGAIGEEYVIFTSSALSLDRTRIYYQFVAQCENEKCSLTMTRIRYWYNEARDGGERYIAEDIITDENGLNKTKTKLARVIGKFRSKTIDYKDNLFKSLATSITEQLQEAATPPEEKVQKEETISPSVVTIDATKRVNTSPITLSTTENTSEAITAAAPVVAATTATSAATTTAAVAVPVAVVAASTSTTKAAEVSNTEEIVAAPASTITVAESSPMAGYKKIEAANIPGNIYQMISQDWMLITAGDDSQFNMMTASWGGLGSLYQKPVALCFINPSRYTYKLMEKNDTYTLSFYKEEYRDVLKLCGTKSGKDTDKVKESGLTPITTPSGSKTFSEAWMIIECKKLVAQSLNPEALKDETLKQEWEGKAMHKMYIGEIINVWVK